MLCFAVFGGMNARAEEKYQLTGKDEVYFSQNVERIHGYLEMAYQDSLGIIKRRVAELVSSGNFYPEYVEAFHKALKRGFEILIDRHDQTFSLLWRHSSNWQKESTLEEYYIVDYLVFLF